MFKTFIWGTGKIADEILKNGLSVEIEGYIETIKTKERFHDKKVFGCSEIPERYDIIIVANQYSNEIYQTAEKQHIDIDKMIFLSPCAYVDSRVGLEWKNKILGEQNFEVYCRRHRIYERTFYECDKQLYKTLNKRESFKIDESIVKPIIDDKYGNAGKVGSYFWQDLWAARLIFRNHPYEHYDIGSRVDGFIAHILAMEIPVFMIDIRPFPTKVQGLKTVIDDATYLRQLADDSIESLSALCSLEHFGLGRYGDPVDPEACFKCFDNIQRKLKTGGKLYISVPIGKERLEFNAHRIFYAATIVQCFDRMRLLEFSCTANGMLEPNINLHKYDDDTICRGNRFGLFYFEKV